MSSSNNLPEVIAAWDNLETKYNFQMAAASAEVALRLEGAGKRMIVGQRDPNEKAVSGQPPKNRTGNLRRSIKGYSNRLGFDVYEAVVGSGMVYARAVEFGGEYAPPSWTDGQRFPFLGPAVKNSIQSGMITRVVMKHLGAL